MWNHTEVINKLCTADNLSSSLHSFLGCHLIPLDKNSGLRPIDIREILCVTASKVNMSQIWKDLALSVCSFQVCAGHEAGCKSILRAMHKVYEEDESETTLLVDASMHSTQSTGKHFYIISESHAHLLPNLFEIVTIFLPNFSSLVEGKFDLLKRKP